MGNFYTNVTVRHADPARIAALLEEMGRAAYVSPAEQGSVVVFDAATEDQDTAKLKALAGDLSRRHGGVALAVLNHDDDVLYYWLYDSGHELDRYDSWPGFPEGRRRAPEGGEVTVLCRACGAADREREVRELLHGPGPGFEVERHEQLVRLLGLPLSAVGMGYEYISQGELPEGIAEGHLHQVGSAAAAPPHPAPAGNVDPAVEAVLKRLRTKMRPSPELAVIIGPDPVSQQEVMGRVFTYVRDHKLMDMSRPPDLAVVPDQALRAVLGVARLSFYQLPEALSRHLTPLE